MARQILTLQLDKITAGDYLQWVRDPEPPALDADLLCVSVEADPLGDTVTATLDWIGPAPPAHHAAPTAGFPLAEAARLPGSRPNATPVRRGIERVGSADERQQPHNEPAGAASASVVGHSSSLQRRRSACVCAR
jgi:hypothetical protein